MSFHNWNATGIRSSAAPLSAGFHAFHSSFAPARANLPRNSPAALPSMKKSTTGTSNRPSSRSRPPRRGRRTGRSPRCRRRPSRRGTALPSPIPRASPIRERSSPFERDPCGFSRGLPGSRCPSRTKWRDSSGGGRCSWRGFYQWPPVPATTGPSVFAASSIAATTPSNQRQIRSFLPFFAWSSRTSDVISNRSPAGSVVSSWSYPT